jgi:IclR family pca regulon transcriptional regulator
MLDARLPVVNESFDWMGPRSTYAVGVPTTQRADASPNNQALERGLSLLSALATRRAPLGLVELGREVGLSKSTCHRYVATLLALGFVEQDVESRRYSLGPSAIDLGHAAIGAMGLTRAAAKSLQALADEVGYTCSMAVLDGPDIVFVDRRRPLRAGNRIELAVQVGTRLPAYCTSMGKVLLAYRDPATVRTVLDRTDLVRRGPKTITAREQLTAALAGVAKHGYAVNDEELVPGLRSVAAPVRDRTRQVVAAIDISLNFGAWNGSMDAIVGRLEGPLRRAANEISHRLGHQQWGSE